MKRLLKSLRLFAILLMIGLVSALSFRAPVPVQAAANNNTTLNFQARLLTSAGAVVADGYYNIRFKIYDGGTAGASSGTGAANSGTGGTYLWTEQYYDSNGVTAGNDNRVRVTNGYFSVNLGSQTAFSGINFEQELWLTMDIGGTTQTATPTYDGEMTNSNARIKLTGVPLAFRSNELAKMVSSNEQLLQFAGSFGQATTITLPDPGSGTANVCYQNSTSCGFATGSGSASYIQNGTSVQTSATFAIQAGNTSNITALIKQLGSQTGDLLQFQNSGGNKVTGIDTNGKLQFADGAGGSYDTNLYRSAADTLKTDDSLIVAGAATVQGANALTLGTASTNTGAILFKGSGGTGTLTLSGPSNPNTFTVSLPNITASDTLCALTLNNCPAVITLGNVDANTKDANKGASIASGVLYLQSADATNPGLVTTSAQTFAGAKTFQDALAGSAGLTISGGDTAITRATSTAFTVANTGATYGFQVDESVGSAITGLKITARASGNGVNIDTISNGSTNEAIIINAKGSGNVNIANTSTGNVNLAGGTGSTGCTVTNSNGNLVCDGTYNTNTFTGSALTFGTAGTATIQPASSQALTITAHATSTWSTDSGNLNLDAASALNIGSTNATSITEGNTSNTASWAVQGTAAATYTIGNANGTGTITLGQSTSGTTQTININSANATASTQTINIGGGTSTTSGGKVVNIANGTPGSSTTNTVAIGTGGTTTGTVGVTIGSVGAAAHTTLIQGGNGSTAIQLQSAGSGTISLGNNAVANTIQLGTTSTNTGNTQTIAIGNLNAAGTTNVTIGTGTSATAGTSTLQAKNDVNLTPGGNVVVGGTDDTINYLVLDRRSTTSNAAGDSCSTAGGIFFNDNNDKFFGCDGTKLHYLVNYADVQCYHPTASGCTTGTGSKTWTKPSGITAVMVILCGGGGGGGGGTTGGSGGARSAGSGGGGAACVQRVFSAIVDTPGGSVLSIGAGGSGGSPGGTGGGTGGGGTAGGNSTFETTALIAGGGGAGANMNSNLTGGTGGGAGQAGNTASNVNIAGGGAGSVAQKSNAGGAGAGGETNTNGHAGEYGGGSGGGGTSNGAGKAGGTSLYGGGGGGSGGSGGSSQNAGAAGGNVNTVDDTNGGGGGSAGAVRSNGGAGAPGDSTKGGQGGGGGGGSTSNSSLTDDGGDGGACGGGGGGGGASVSGGTSPGGTGGTGGVGCAWVISW